MTLIPTTDRTQYCFVDCGKEICECKPTKNIKDMKTLEQIKEEYAKSHAFNDWKSVYSYLGLLQRQSAMDEIAKLYATEYAKEALRLASENATMEAVHNGVSRDIIINKHSILSENNLPKHR